MKFDDNLLTISLPNIISVTLIWVLGVAVLGCGVALFGKLTGGTGAGSVASKAKAAVTGSGS